MNKILLIFLPFLIFSTGQAEDKSNDAFGECAADFPAQGDEDRMMGSEIQSSMEAYINSLKGAEANERQKYADIRQVSVQKEKVTVVFYRAPGAGTSPDSMSQAEEKALIEKHLKKWSKDTPKYKAYGVSVRFHGECARPPQPKK